MQIVGPSFSGKTTFLYDSVKDAPCYFRGDDGSPCWSPKILYCYGSAWQPIFNQFQEMGVQFHEGLPDNMEDLCPPETRPGLTIMDDLMHVSSKSSQVTNLLTKGKHHLDLCCHFAVAKPLPFRQGASWSKSELSLHRSLQESCGHPLHQKAYSGTLSRLKSPKVALSRLKSPKVALNRLKSPLPCNDIKAKIPL